MTGKPWKPTKGLWIKDDDDGDEDNDDDNNNRY